MPLSSLSRGSVALRLVTRLAEPPWPLGTFPRGQQCRVPMVGAALAHVPTWLCSNLSGLVQGSCWGQRCHQLPHPVGDTWVALSWTAGSRASASGTGRDTTAVARGQCGGTGLATSARLSPNPPGMEKEEQKEEPRSVFH